MSATKYRTRFNDADEAGFLAAGEGEVNNVISDFLTEKNLQKSVNRKIIAAATRKQIREAGRDALMYGTFLDWRGRLYFNGAGLAPQGKDAGRGSLEAAKGKALGAEGLHHLKVGVATTWGTFCDGRGGLDKAGLGARAREVDKMLADGTLRAMVDGARQGSHFGWRLAEEPVQFLALAGDLLAAVDSGSPEDYVSHVMIGYDATCSGLQILAAVTGCEETARLVNVAPREDGARADIYLAVADKLTALCADLKANDDGSLAQALALAMDAIEGEAADRKAERKASPEVLAARKVAKGAGDHWALFWSDRGITRAVTKNPVMVYCYGGTKRTFAGTIREETGAPWGACMWLAMTMYDDVLASLLPKAHAMMLALQEMARVLAKHGKPVEFVAADGLPFRQAVMETEKAQVRCHLADGRTIQAVTQKWTQKLNAQKQASGIAPNLVHHWDALFLRNVVRALAAAGIEAFFTVHDCFYLRAGDWAEGWQIIRRVFVETFSGNVAGAIWDQIESRANGVVRVRDKVAVALRRGPNLGGGVWNEAGLRWKRRGRTVVLPPCPAMGSLDLSGAMESEFLFS
jgi:DNA-directed RNA polymerase